MKPKISARSKRLAWLGRGAALLMVLGLCGCFQVEDHLTLQPDGSGTVKLTIHTKLPEEMFEMLSSSRGSQTPIYPPIDESEARHFFPAKDFKLKVEEQGEEEKSLTIEAAFKDVNALLASPYARAHQLVLTVQGGVLRLKARSGAEAAVGLSQLKDPDGGNQFEVPGLEEARKHSGEMRFEFRVTLPAAVTDANGARDQHDVRWVAERAKCKDDDEFAGKFQVVFEASCDAAGLKFTPNTPPRLGLVPFAELAAGKYAGTAVLPDTNKIAAAAHFVPYSLQVTRTLDLSGEGSGQESQAELTGVIQLPAELAPPRWGQAKLEEALDAKGTSLVPKASEDNPGRHYRSFSSHVWGDASDADNADEEADGAAKPKAKDSGQAEHMVSLTFKAPEWKVKSVSRIKGSVELQYLGGSEVIKLSNAVPAKLVMDISKGVSSMNFTSDLGEVSEPRLTELGASVKVQMAMVQNGMTTLSLAMGGKSALMDVQVFDAQGRPWPTTLAQSDEESSDEERTCQVMVGGKPQPPFSIALSLGGVGAAVTVPILVENVPVGDQ